jgi:TRAP-type transport system small permease protein
MGSVSYALRAIDNVLLKITKVVAITSFFLLTILITANVFVRFVPVVSLHWFDEIIELLFAYMVFYGAAALWITNEHFSAGDWIDRRIKNARWRHSYKLLLKIVAFIFAVIFLYYSLRLSIMAHDVTNVFAIPKRVLYSCLPISGAVMVLSSIRQIIEEAAKVIDPQGEAVERCGL